MKTYLIILLFFNQALLSQAQEKTLVINEVMTKNTSTILDENSNFSPYIELHNTSDQIYSFYENYLSDDPTNLKKWKISNNSTLWGKRFKIFWCDGQNGTYHTNFKLEDGETLYLSRLGVIIDSVKLGKQYLNISYGRYPDGEDNWASFVKGTPGKTNDAKRGTKKLDDVIFSNKGGIYSGKITVSLSCNSFSKIYYTTDGSEPTDSSRLYSAPIVSDTSIVIRARTFADGKLPGDIVTQSFIILTRPLTLPVISLSTDAKYLFDEKIGIYVEGVNGITGRGSQVPVNWNMDWKRPVNVEYFDIKRKQQLNFYGSTKINGGYSRTNPQKSLAIYMDKINGFEKTDYPFFINKKNLEFETILLRNSGNDFKYSMLRDAYMQTLVQDGMNVDYLAYQPIILFINGQYWGIENLREKPGDDYVRSNFGYGNDNIDVLWNNMEIENGNSDHYSKMINYLKVNNIALPQHYEYIKTQMDIQEYIDYQITQLFVANTDWPGNNIRYWRPKSADGKWRWMLCDLDFGFGLNGRLPTMDMMSFATKTGQAGWPNSDWSTFLFRTLLKNETFKNEFINRFVICLGTTFRSERTVHILDSLSKNIESEMIYHLIRWPRPYSSWTNSIRSMDSFARKRPQYVYLNLAQFFGLKKPIELQLHSSINGGSFVMNDVVIPDTVFQGKYFDSTLLKVYALPPSGYKFKEWRVKHLSIIDDYFFPEGSTWRYSSNGNDLGTEWINFSYNDNSWLSGAGDFGYGEFDEKTIISPGTSPVNHYKTYYFRKKFFVSDTSNLSEISLELLIDDGAVIYLNEKEIMRVNMPEGPVDYNTMALSDLKNYYISKKLDFSAIDTGENIIAVEVHIHSPSNQTMSFDLSFQKKLQLNTGTDSIVNTKIFMDTVHTGMSLTAYFEPDTIVKNLIINEICASNKTLKDDRGFADDWFELFNPTNDSIDAGGIYVTNSLANPLKYRIPVGYPEKTSVPPNGYLRFWADDQSFQGPLHTGIQFERMGDQAGIVQKIGSEIKWIDSISFGYQDYWYSFGRYTDGSANWQYMPITPGASNQKGLEKDSVLKNVLINEICADNATTPDPKGKYSDWIELYNPTNDSINIAGMLITDDPSKIATARIPYGYSQKTTIPPKGFLVLWCDQSSDLDPLRVDIKLKKEGEYIALSQMNGTICDSFTFPAQNNSFSFGRYKDGEDTLTFLMPTAGAPNKKASEVKRNSTDKICHIFPNPACHTLSVICNEEGRKQLIVCNMAGNIIMERVFYETFFAVNISDLMPSLYIVAIRSQHGTEYFKILKQ